MATVDQTALSGPAYHLTGSGAKAYFCFDGTPVRPEDRAGFDQVAGCEQFFVIGPDPAWADMSPDFEAVAVEATDTAVVLYTSGTTGTPKGAELSHANMVLNALTCHKLFGAIDHDVHLITLPLFHSFGQTVQMNSGFGAGATLVLLPRFTAPAALSLMQDEKVTRQSTTFMKKRSASFSASARSRCSR
jgi:long-chain acyl-CoA synthetase